jgi:hypothetical protein
MIGRGSRFIASAALAIAFVMGLSMVQTSLGGNEDLGLTASPMGEGDDHGPVVGDWTISGTELQSDNRTLTYRWYDMFNVSYGDYWDLRDDQVVLTDEYPYVHQTWMIPYYSIYNSNMRLDITGENLHEINMNYDPQFLPRLGYVGGGEANLDWRFGSLSSRCDQQRRLDKHVHRHDQTGQGCDEVGSRHA